MPEPSFEEALENLEKIVEQLEAGNLSLDETLKKFEEGIRLSRLCDKKLKQAQKKVSMLTRDEQGDFKEIPFAEQGQEEPKQADKEGARTDSLFDE
ncbi:MAG: exodeoxyribonuclease VII small subunit [Candidatus Lindowbacteria bacterium]|nr:exodeoxyribonuclease VII small subunit [Candidatus Lindowbacteria bacterium]